jgi:hypothetical protein
MATRAKLKNTDPNAETDQSPSPGPNKPPMAKTTTTAISSPQRTAATETPKPPPVAGPSVQVQPVSISRTSSSTIDDPEANMITLQSLLDIVLSLQTEIRKRNAKESNPSDKQELTEETPLLTAPRQSIKTLFSKFTPTKINPKFAEQSLDQLESWMEINGITSDHEKFQLLKISIEPETYREVAAALKNPPDGRQYDTLKAAIIKTYTDSEHTRIKALLSGITLGDRRPSQLLSQMTNLYKGPRDKIFKELFYSRLPATVRAIVTSMTNNAKDDPSIDIVAQWADEINEQIREPKIEALTEVKTEHKNISSSLETIMNMLGRLTKNNLFNSKQPAKYNSDKKSERKKNIPNDAFYKLPSDGICFYHRKYGNNRHENRRCDPECRLNKAWNEFRSKNSEAK